MRDFLILHYRRGERRNSEFRRHCANMSIPDGLAPQIEPFRRTGRVAILEPEGFAEPSWVPILMGLGVMPERYDPMWDLLDLGMVRQHLTGVHEVIAHTVAAMPKHDDTVRRLTAA